MAKKRSRKQKTSRGERRSSNGVELNNLQKVLFNRGMMDHADEMLQNEGRPIRAWRGVNNFDEPFNAEQVRLNRKLYPHLFGGK